jgi:hypothetical protein
MSELNLTQVQLDWCLDILKRIQEVLDDPNTDEIVMLNQIRWLTKQALKVEREE